MNNAKTLFESGCSLCLTHADTFRALGLEKATNWNTHPREFRESIYNIYNELVNADALIEAYCLMRLAFGELSTEQLMKLLEENRLITEHDAYACAEHDRGEK